MAEDTKLPVLYSYAYLRGVSEEVLSDVLTDPRFEVLIDSGAFTAFNTGKIITLERYSEWLTKWGDHLSGYLALDVVQNPQATEDNLNTMLKDGFKPIPVHVFGDDQARMDYLFSLSDWVALAGLRRPHRGHAPRSYVAIKMRWAKGRRVHWLGYTRQTMLRQFKPYSCDSASWSSGSIWGLCFIYCGRGEWLSLGKYPQFMREKSYLNERAQLGALWYGIDLNDLLDRENWKGQGSLVRRLVTLSWVRYVLEFREMFGVRIYLAGQPNNVETFREAITAVNQRRHNP